MSIKFPNMKRFFSLFLAAVMMVTLLAVNAHAANANKITDYGDAYGHWAYEALTWAVDNGVMVGTSGDKLNPDGYLTRAQMAAMIDRLFGTYRSADISRYTDVPRGSWYYDYIAQAVHMGTFAGYSNRRMGPNDNITREQAIVVLARTVCLPSAGNSALARFPDRNQVGAWAADSVAAMVERGYVSGYNDGRLNPKGQITRAEMAQIMCNIFQSVHNSGEITGTYRDTVLVRGAANIKDAVFESDLIIANGLGEKSLDLDSITVKGRLVVWGGSTVNVSGKSIVAGVVLPRNDGPVQVVFDAAATELSQKGCSIVKPSTMDQGNKVLFTDKADKPTIAFDLPAYRYVGDSLSVKTTLTGADAVTWELTHDGKSIAMPEGFTKDGGTCFFMEAGRYTLKGTVENSGGTGFCEKTVEVLPIGNIAFSLPEYGYTDRAEDVKLLTKNDLTGSVVWTLTKDGANQPLASFTKDGGTLVLAEPGKYTLTATLTDAAGKQYTASQTITILPVISLTVTASADKVHEDDTAEIGLTVEGGKPTTVRWALTRDGKEAAVTLRDNGGALTFDGAGDYSLTAIAKDAQGREFSSEPAAVKVIPNLTLSLTADADKLHEDEAAAISLTVEHGTPSTVQWAMTRDGEGVSVSLDDHGGNLAFDGAGAYVLTSAVTDELGKEYTAALPLEVCPVIVLTLDAPETAHVDQPAAVSLSGTDLDVVWEVTSEAGTAIDTSLTNEGSKIAFPSAGNYTITASVTDHLGRTFSTSDTISVWDTMGLSFKLPEFTHPDETVKVKMTSENVGDSKIEWSLTVDGQPVSLSAGIKGSLDNAGGSVKFLQTGANILTASVTDGLGRAFTYEQTIQVYPVLHLELTADAATHTDEQISVTLEKDTALPVTWKITPSNDPSAAIEYNGDLTDNGGTIQITSAGTYDIAASVTDATGRVFAAPAVSVMVYPVAGLDFTLPAAAWTDSSTPVDLLTSDLQGQDVTWTLTKDGTAVSLTGSMLGDLGNQGGKVRFPEVGTYTLTASAVDALGREYSCSQTIRIYPVVGLTVSTSDMSHTDTAEDVKLTTENLGSNEVVWTVLRDGKEIMPSFDLTTRGGHGFFPEPGLYTFTASVTDGLGRVTTASTSIQIYPVGVSGFYLPKMFHTDSVVTLVTGFEELGENPLRWSLTRNGENVPVSDYVTGELTSDGGKIQFKQAGEYRLRASFKDAGGRNYSYEQSFTVYPIPVIAWTMPNYAHTDSTFTVAVESKNVVEDAAIKWHIDDTYGLRQNWGTYVAGTLTTIPGDIRIKHAGVFTLGCEITDPTGRVFSFDGPSIEVLAEQELQVSIIEQQVYTGETVQVRTLGNNIELPVEWSLEKDGKPADISTYVTGDLNNLGGAIQFTQGGTFRLIGTLRDGLGRTFTASDTITVLPVGSLQFSMADMEYVGNRVPVVMDKLFNPDGSTITWSAQKDGAACLIDLSALDNDGGTVIFPEPGEYTLTATLRDSNGKTATASQSITIIFKAALTVTAPDSIHIGTKFPVGISGAGSLPVSWGVKLGGKPVTLDSNTGFLSNDGGTLAMFEEGIYTITATVRDDAGNLTSAFANITVTNTAPVIDRFTANATRNMKDGRFYADLNAVASDPDGDAVHLEWSSEYQQDGYYEVGTHTIRVRAVDEWGAASAWESRTIEFINNAPVITSFTASVARQTSGNNFLANISATGSDPDGDTVTLEWGGDYNSSGWYSRSGSHTIRVRAVDSYGAASAWQEKTIEFVNQAPSKPVISRNPANGVVRPSQAVTITASSTDPEGDSITYEWDGRDKETTTYGYGKHLVKCRAVDAYGAASPWSAIVFFVADDVGGGMTLTSANSFIEETGISFNDDGETIYGYITEYTFDVPPVSGHNGSDYGRIEAYNILTGQWDEIAYKTTNNGVTLSGQLPTGTYQAKYPGDRNHEESPTSSAIIRTTRQNASDGTVQSAVYTYDGTPKSLAADVPAGCTEVVQTFTGTNGTAYGPTTEPPTNPGVYNVKVSYTMQSGYAELQPQYATLTINKTTPARPLAPVVTGVTDSSITIKVEDGMAYSIDGGNTWQTTDTFTGLTRDTTYEIKVKAVETACYKELEGPSTMQATEKTVVTFERFADQTVEYNGHGQTYTLPKSVPGIASMTITGYDGIATPPVTVGDYEVNIDFVAAEGYKLPETLPAPVLHITRASGEAGTVRPVLKDETVTYTGAPQRYHGADGIEGIASVALTYTGADGVESTTAPTNAGVYHVTAIFSPDANHTLAAGNYSATLTIRKAGQDTPMASLESSSAHELTVSAIPGAEYRIDGGSTWQTSNTFSGLEADKNYTVLVRMAEDENHTASGTQPVSGRTTDQPVDILDVDMPDYSTVYNGNRQPYPYTSLLTDMEGIRSVSIMYVGTLASGKPYETSEAPVDAGTYKVRFYLVAEDGYDLSAEQVYADMTISKAPQTMPAAPTIARCTTTTMNTTGDMEYSDDGGETWNPCADHQNVEDRQGETLLVRIAATDDSFKSDPTTVTVPVRGEAPVLTVDNATERMDSTAAMEYSTDGGKTWTKCDPDMDVSHLTGQTILVREAATEDKFASDIAEVRIPNRTENPTVALDTITETVNTTEDMDYSTDGGATWNPCTKPLDVSGMTGQTIIIRNHGDDDSFPSNGVTIAIPARREAPRVEVDSRAQTVSSDKGVEFSADNGKTWTALSKPLNTADHLGQTILFRFPATKEDFASRTVTVVISNHPGAPVLVFDPNGETLNTTPDMEYSTDGGKTWKPCTSPMDVSDLAGKEILIRYPGKGDGLPSDPITVKIPDRRKAPNVTVSGNTLTGTDKTMEYRLLPDGKWIAVTGSTVKGLAPGTYEIRYAATSTEMASQVQTVVIDKNSGGIGDLTTPGSKLSLLNRKDHIAYIAGRTSTQAAPNADITRAEVAAILYRLLTQEAKSAYGTNINRFKDVPAGAWYETEVSTLANMGVISGYQDGTFGPQRNITRAELATILARFCDTSGSAAVLDRFTDISHSWARKYINLAAEAGLVYGYSRWWKMRCSTAWSGSWTAGRFRSACCRRRETASASASRMTAAVLRRSSWKQYAPR